jgi:hypothetical protein
MKWWHRVLVVVLCLSAAVVAVALLVRSSRAPDGMDQEALRRMMEDRPASMHVLEQGAITNTVDYNVVVYTAVEIYGNAFIVFESGHGLAIDRLER